MKCDICETEFQKGHRPDGLPNGIFFLWKSGEVISLCADCLMALGQMTDKEKGEFFKTIKGEGQS